MQYREIPQVLPTADGLTRARPVIPSLWMCVNVMLSVTYNTRTHTHTHTHIYLHIFYFFSL